MFRNPNGKEFINMEVLEIAKLIENRGGRLYLVGGALRDKLLNRPILMRIIV